MSDQVETITLDAPIANQDNAYIQLLDVNKTVFGMCQAQHFTNGDLRNIITVKKTIGDASSPTYSFVGAVITNTGTTYCVSNHPRPDNYGTDIVTTKAMKDWAAMKVLGNTDIHVNAETGSDTADLFAGRGFSEEKPFKTFAAALSFVMKYMVGTGIVNIILHSDVTMGVISTHGGNLGGLKITSYSTRRTINISPTGHFDHFDGRITFTNIKFVSNNADRIIRANANSYARFSSNIEIDGSFVVSVVSALLTGIIDVAENISGTPTGKKYSCVNGGMIIGASKIPGTEDGTCDANSKAFG